MNTEKEIKLLLEEAEAQLTLSKLGQDDYALVRYNYIMDRVRSLRNQIK